MSENSKKEVVYAIELAEDLEMTTWRVCYMGETARGTTRYEEHARLVGGASRLAASIAKHGRAAHRIRIISNDFSGPDERKALETFLMIRFDTLLSNQKRMRDFFSYANREFDFLHPDIELPCQPRNFRLNQKRSVATKFQERIDAAGKAFDELQTKGTLSIFSKTEEQSMFQKIDADLAMNEGIKEPLDRILVARAVKPDDVDMEYGVRAFAELVMGNYKRTFVDAVDLNTFTSELNIIKDKLKDDPEYEDLAGVITALGLVGHPDKARKVSSAAAAAGLEMVIAMIATREEEQLKWTHDDVRKKIYNVRQWTRVNGMEKPKQKASCATQNSLGVFLTGWKSPQTDKYGGGFTDLASCDVVMRDVSWWPGFVGSVAKNTNDWKTLNAQLLDGYSYKDEPDFVGKKGLVKGGGGNRTVYGKLNKLVNQGSGTPADFELAIAGLPESRAKWYRDRYNAKREPTLAQLKVDQEAARKKRKLDNIGLTSALPEAVATDWKTLNAQLLDGYSHKDEPDFVGKKGLVKWADGNRSVYGKLSNLVNSGTGTPADVELALAGLPEPRAKWYRDRYNAKREPMLAQLKANRKKQKLDNLGSTSALPEADDATDDDEADDADDDDDEADDADDDDGDADEADADDAGDPTQARLEL